MTKGIFEIAAGLALSATGMPAQSVTVYGAPRTPGPVFVQQFQQAGTLGVTTGQSSISILSRDPSQAVTGHPVSGTEVRKSLQTLGDGTEISTSNSNLFYRDSQGRTRVDETTGSRGFVTIQDPVAKVTITLIPATKTARKLPMIIGAMLNATTGTDPDTNIQLQVVPRVAEPADPAPSASAGTTPAGGRGGRGGGRGFAEKPLLEDLGAQVLNGVLAYGTRNTQIIPQGAIGNNRDIHIVYERWYSKDLQMLIKTVNSDPRFGESTYELTNISQDAPDPTLFQIPTDYTVASGRGRGGR